MAEPLRIDHDARQVWVGHRPAHVTPVGYRLLRALARRPGVAMTAAELLQGVWGATWPNARRVVACEICRLRTAFGDRSYIRTSYRYGYALNPDLFAASAEMPDTRRERITRALVEAWPHLFNDAVYVDQVAAVALAAIEENHA